MPNHYFIISEVQFFNNKEDEKTWKFISGTEIDLNQPCNSKMPTLIEIKKALVDFGLETRELINQFNRVELSAIKEINVGLWLIFINIEDERKEVNMFEVGRGSDPELIVDFVKYLVKTHGNFLYYFDGGKMSLITANKDKEIILSEIYSN